MPWPSASRRLSASVLPMAMPAYVCAYAYTWLLDVAGPVQTAFRSLTGLRWGQYWFPEIRSLPGAAVVLAMVLYPYVYLLCRGAFQQQSVCLVEASRTLGHSLPRCFLRLALPLALVDEGGLAKEEHWWVYLSALLIGFFGMVPFIIYGEKKRQMRRVLLGAVCALLL